MNFDAGALLFRIQTAGRQTFESDMQAVDRTVTKTGASADTAAKQVSGLGTATDDTGKKSRTAKAPLDDQASATRKVGAEADDAARKQKRQAAVTEEQIAASRQLAGVLAIGGAATASMIALSVAKYAEFDKAMSQTSAATMASAADQRILGEAALEAGADTAYSAAEAAAAEEELAKAGQSVADIVGGSLNGALALAAAGQLQVARSAEIMATTLTQFRLPAEQAAMVSDVLAAGAGKAQGSVDDLSLALSYVGPLAGSVGFALDETAGTIAYFATQGIIGEKAGTSLRGVLASLQAPSAAAASEMATYGLNMFDANGNMLSLAGIAEQLRSRLGGLTQQERLAALGRIFGNESLNAATLLYEGGAAAVNEWTANVNDSGYAAEQAAMRQDNLAGDIEKLGGAFDTALIRTGSGANDTLREMVQAVTTLVDIYGELPAPVHTVALGVGAVTAAGLLFAGGAVTIRSRLMELQAEFAKTGTSMRRTAIVGAAAGIALAGVATVFGILISKAADMSAGTEEFANSLDEASGAATAYTRELVAKRLAETDAFDQAEKAGISQRELTDAILRGGDAYEEVNQKLRAAHKASGGFDAGLGNTINTVKDMNVQLTDAKKQHDQVTAATETNTESTTAAADAYLEAAGGAEDLESQLRTLMEAIMKANGVGQDAVSSNITYRDAVADVEETIAKAREGAEGYALSLDQSTQVGRDNLGMLVDMAAKSQAAADAQFAVDQNTDGLRQRMEEGRQTLIDRATDLGYNADEAARLADEIYRIPTEKEFTVIANTTAAEQALARLAQIKTVQLIPELVGSPATGMGTVLKQADGGKVEFFADGGRSTGGTSEHHTAQFARAGTWRVWAEPETGGEWYLPNAPQKRQQSLGIAQQMLGEWGYAVVPADARRYAEGSPIAPAAAVSAPRELPPIIINANGMSAAEARSLISEELKKYYG